MYMLKSANTILKCLDTLLYKHLQNAIIFYKLKIIIKIWLKIIYKKQLKIYKINIIYHKNIKNKKSLITIYL